MRVTLDTNIYVSAAPLRRQADRSSCRWVSREQFGIAVSRPILDETLRVLREKFGWSDDELRDAEAAIVAATYRVTPTETLDVVKRDLDGRSDSRVRGGGRG